MTLLVIIAVIGLVLLGLWFAVPASRQIIVGVVVALIGFLIAALTELGSLLQGLV